MLGLLLLVAACYCLLLRDAGNMVVNYSERLVTLLKDCRQLVEMGMAVSDKIRAAAADAEKFYRYGVMLKKVRWCWVGHFYVVWRMDLEALPASSLTPCGVQGARCCIVVGVSHCSHWYSERCTHAPPTSPPPPLLALPCL